MPTVVVSLVHPTLGPDRIAAALRAGDPPVVVRVAEDRLVLDLRTVRPEDEATLLSGLDAPRAAESRTRPSRPRERTDATIGT